MACGLPIVSVDFPARYEKIKHGENCLMVPEGDINGLAAAINKLLVENEYAKSMGHLNHKRIKEKYDIKQSAEKFIELARTLQK